MKFLLLLLLTAFCSSVFSQKEKKHLAQVSLDGKYGFIDVFGHEVVPLIYDDAGSWGNNLVPVNIGKYTHEPGPVEAAVDPGPAETKDSAERSKHTEQYKTVAIDLTEKKGKWGYCNASGQLVIPVQFTNASFFSEGMAAVEINDKWGFISTSGKTAVQPVYDTVGYFSQGLAVVAKNGSYGYINLKGEEVIKLQYLNAEAFQNGYARVFEKYVSKNNNKTSIGRLINLQGKTVTDARYDIESNFSNGLFSFLLAGPKPENSFAYGLINTAGQIVAQPVYKEISDFSNGLARVMVYKRHEFYDEYVPHYGYINTRGKEIVKPTLANAESFSYGMAVIARFDKKDDGESEHALMNTKGEHILGFNWKDLNILDSGHLLANAIKNKNETVIIDPKGKKIGSLGDNGFTDLGNGLFTIINVNNESAAFIGLDKKISIDFSKNKKKRFLSYQFGLIRFRDADSNYEELRHVKLGLMDLKGNVIVKPKYNEISDFEPIDSAL
jgi:hypothetical protein